MKNKSIGSLIEQLNAARDIIRGINSDLSKAKEVKTDLESRLLESMEAQGTDTASYSGASVSITRVIVPLVTEWDEFYAYIRKNDAFYLLERRPASVAYRDLLEATDGEAIPGVSSYERVGISMRKKE